jgi:hypothetical protein
MFVSLLPFQPNNKQSSILSPASAGPISQDETTSVVIHIIPFLKISKLFSQCYRLQRHSKPHSPADRTNGACTTTHHYQHHYHSHSTATTNHYHYHSPQVRAQDNSRIRRHDTGSSITGCRTTVLSHLIHCSENNELNPVQVLRRTRWIDHV